MFDMSSLPTTNIPNMSSSILPSKSFCRRHDETLPIRHTPSADGTWSLYAPECTCSRPVSPPSHQLVALTHAADTFFNRYYTMFPPCYTGVKHIPEDMIAGYDSLYRQLLDANTDVNAESDIQFLTYWWNEESMYGVYDWTKSPSDPTCPYKSVCPLDAFEEIGTAIYG